MEFFRDRKDRVESLWGELLRFLDRKLPRRSNTEDIVQEAILEALRRPPRNSSSVGAWLKVVAIRRATRLGQLERKRQAREFAVARPEAMRFPLDRNESMSDLVSRYVQALNEPYRTVVRMRYYEERDLDEIARLLQRPPATVRSQLKRGLDQLRVRLSPDSDTTRSRRHGLLALVFARFREHPRFAGAVAGVAGVVGIGWVMLHDAPDERLEVDGVSVRAALPDVGSHTRVVDTVAAIAPSGPLDVEMSAAPPPSSDATAWTFDLNGVVSYGSASPVSDAAIWLATARSGSARIVARTDAGGRYMAEGVSALDWVWAEKDGHLPTARTLAGSTRDGRLDLNLEPPVRLLRGRVVAADGSPVAAAVVTRKHVREKEDLHGIGIGPTIGVGSVLVSATTDGDGRFSMPCVSPKFPNQGLLYIRATNQPPSIQPIPVVSGRHTDVEFRLPPPGRLVARVLDGRGIPLPGCQMEVLLPEPFEARRAITDRDGALDLDHLPPGPYALRLLRHPHEAIESCFAEGLIGEGESAMEITLAAGSILHGIASENGRRAEGRRVILKQIGGGPFGPDERTTTTAEDGSFAFTGCDPAGRFLLQLLDSGGRFVEARAADLAPSLEPVRLDSDGAPSLAVMNVACEGVSRPTMVALHSATLSEPLFLRVAEDGNFTSPPIPPGSYSLRFWVPGIGTWAQTHELTANAGPERIRFGGTGELEIRVIPPDTRPDPALVTVQVSCPSFFGPPATEIWRLVSRGSPGVDRVDLPPGDYEYIVRASGFPDELHRVTIAEGTTTSEEITLQEGVATALEIVAERDIRKEMITVLFDRSGRTQRLLRRAHARPGVTDTLDVPVVVPMDCVAVRVRTKSGLRGRVAVSAAELIPGRPIRIELE